MIDLTTSAALAVSAPGAFLAGWRAGSRLYRRRWREALALVDGPQEPAARWALVTQPASYLRTNDSLVLLARRGDDHIIIQQVLVAGRSPGTVERALAKARKRVEAMNGAGDPDAGARGRIGA